MRVPIKIPKGLKNNKKLKRDEPPLICNSESEGQQTPPPRKSKPKGLLNNVIAKAYGSSRGGSSRNSGLAGNEYYSSDETESYRDECDDFSVISGRSSNSEMLGNKKQSAFDFGNHLEADSDDEDFLRPRSILKASSKSTDGSLSPVSTTSSKKSVSLDFQSVEEESSRGPNLSRTVAFPTEFSGLDGDVTESSLLDDVLDYPGPHPSTSISDGQAEVEQFSPQSQDSASRRLGGSKQDPYFQGGNQIEQFTPQQSYGAPVRRVSKQRHNIQNYDAESEDSSSQSSEETEESDTETSDSNSDSTPEEEPSMSDYDDIQQSNSDRIKVVSLENSTHLEFDVTQTFKGHNQALLDTKEEDSDYSSEEDPLEPFNHSCGKSEAKSVQSGRSGSRTAASSRSSRSLQTGRSSASRSVQSSRSSASRSAQSSRSSASGSRRSLNGKSGPRNDGTHSNENGRVRRGSTHNRDGQRPSNDGRRPSNDGRRPSNDGRRPSNDGRRPSNDGNNIQRSRDSSRREGSSRNCEANRSPNRRNGQSSRSISSRNGRGNRPSGSRNGPSSSRSTSSRNVQGSRSVSSRQGQNNRTPSSRNMQSSRSVSSRSTTQSNRQASSRSLESGSRSTASRQSKRPSGSRTSKSRQQTSSYAGGGSVDPTMQACPR